MNNLILGTWGLAGESFVGPVPSGYGPMDGPSATSVLNRAWQAGVRTVDLAPQYGNGQGIDRVIAWERSRNQRFAKILKIGRHLMSDGVYVSTMDIPALLAELHALAGVVGVPEVLLLKDPSPAFFLTDRGEEALRELKVQFPNVTIGFSSHVPALFGRLKRGDGWMAQIEFNAITYASVLPAIRHLRALGSTVVAMQPLFYGFLTDKCLERDLHFASNDWRSTLDRKFVSLARAAAQHFFSLVSKEFPAYSFAQIALAFVFATEDLNGVVIGPRTTKHLDTALGAIDLAKSDRFRAWHSKVLQCTQS